MVHIVRKKGKYGTYLSLQKSILKDGKQSTEHVAYLGNEKKFSKESLEKIIKQHNKKEEKKKWKQPKK